MNEANAKTPLFPEFEPVPAEAWEARIHKDMRDATYQSLFWQTEDGPIVKPFYTKADLPANRAQQPGDFPYVRNTKNRDNHWENIQTFYVRKDCHPFIDKAVEALHNGAEGIHFVLRDSVNFDFPYLLSQPRVIGSSISFTFPVSPETYLNQYLETARNLNIDLNLLHGFIQFEPVDDLPYDLPPYGSIPEMLELVKEAPNLYPITISGHQFSNRGATLSQEVAIALSAAVSILDCAQKEAIAPEKVIGRIQMHLTAGTNYFFEIAKFRALRLLWSALVQSYGLPAELATRLKVHVSTSRWHHTVFDAHVNLLRTTTEAMSAILGGCDSLSVTPFDKIYKNTNDFSERIARNISVILKEGAYLDKAIDPAAGSYYLESLTRELAESSWKIFQQLEEKGGFRHTLKSGYIALEIKKAADEKFRALTNREMILVGTNKYPNPHETIEFNPESLMQNKFFDTGRAAYPFEIMRLASEMHFRKKKKKARAVIAVIGTKISEHLHASFAKEFFDCANFETVIFHFETIADAINALENDKTKVVVLSGSEEQYQHFDHDLAARIKNHESKPVLILAATPQHMQDEMMQKGFDEFIFQGCNMDTIISCIQQKINHEDEPLD